METIGLIGLGKIGLPIADNLIKSGYRPLRVKLGKALCSCGHWRF
jgi:3-hydroxyisobutyrate dehydrogenase-like beta-hydroxyacid dehydrogenase